MDKRFDYTLDFAKLDFRAHPELYRIGVGEQGVLLVQPYKNELLPHWRFKTEDEAKKSGEILFARFEEYLHQNDFVGADMARKYLQMGFTRARRYANHPDGKKYVRSKNTKDSPDSRPYPYSSGTPHKGNEVMPQAADATSSEKARAAAIFKIYWDKARQHPEYLRQKEQFKAKYYQS